MRPRSIAILGASDRSRWSRTAFDNLREGGFGGAVHLVNRRGGQVHGQAAAGSVAALGEAPDLGLVLVPAEAVADSVRDLGAAGARSAVILTSGFAELGAEGATVQQSVADAARQAGVRLLGPNSLGFINFADGVCAWTTPVRAPTRRDGVAIVSQSGATAYFLSTLAWRQDVGLSHVVATGNEADLDLAAVALSLLRQPATRSLALFIETVRDPAGFLALARAALEARKPLVVLKVGASEVTAKSALAHTGALVGDDRVFDGLCAQYGIIRARSVEELLTTADIMGRAGPLRPGGLGVISNSGGICEIAADSAAARGLVLPELAADTAAALRATIPGFATPHNPLDLTGAITPEQCGAVVDIVAAQPGLAAVLCPYYEVPTDAVDVNERLSGLHAALASGLSRAPVPGFVVSYTGTHLSPLSKRIVAETGMPYLACGLDLAVTALSGSARWSERLRQPPAGAAKPPVAEPERPRSEHTALRCLARHGVPVVPAVLAKDAEQAVQAAEAMDGAVVLKIASPDIGHKSDMGGVALGLRGAEAVRDAHARIRAAAEAHAPQAAVEGVLVAPMRPRGIELFVGVTRDPQWGAVLAVGLGGVWVEVLKDVALRLLPVDAAEVRRMLASLRGAAMLAGQRGIPAADLDAVAEAVARIGDAALAFGPDLAALDVNPLWVRGDQVEALDALCIWQDGVG
nr:acetate--CoA ligase family protein [Roseomonas marmotae]